MISGYSMYVWWYIRRFYESIKDDNIITKRGYVISHYSKFVRPGSLKIYCTENPFDKVYITAYKNNKKIILIINENSSQIRLIFKILSNNIKNFKLYQKTESYNFRTIYLK